MLYEYHGDLFAGDEGSWAEMTALGKCLNGYRYLPSFLIMEWVSIWAYRTKH